jgi:hypothetical protein
VSRIGQLVDFARGCPEHPVGYAEIAVTFADPTGSAAGTERARHVIEVVERAYESARLGRAVDVSSAA